MTGSSEIPSAKISANPAGEESLSEDPFVALITFCLYCKTNLVTSYCSDLKLQVKPEKLLVSITKWE